MPLGIHPIETLLSLLLSAFWLWMLVDCLINKSLKGTQKVLWFLLILLTLVVGALLYLLMGRSPKKAPVVS